MSMCPEAKLSACRVNVCRTDMGKCKSQIFPQPPPHSSHPPLLNDNPPKPPPSFASIKKSFNLNQTETEEEENKKEESQNLSVCKESATGSFVVTISVHSMSSFSLRTSNLCTSTDTPSSYSSSSPAAAPKLPTSVVRPSLTLGSERCVVIE